jgi:hypothetical protein
LAGCLAEPKPAQGAPLLEDAWSTSEARPPQLNPFAVVLYPALWHVGLAGERLLPCGREDIPWATMAAILVIARLCEPSSELHIAEDWYRRTALSDLLDVPNDQFNDDRLYRARILDLTAHHERANGKLIASDHRLRGALTRLAQARESGGGTQPPNARSSSMATASAR